MPTDRGTDLLKELDGMRASLDVVKNNTDVVQRELYAMQIFEETHDVAWRILMTTSEFSYNGDGFEIVAKSIDVGSEIKMEKPGKKPKSRR